MALSGLILAASAFAGEGSKPSDAILSNPNYYTFGELEIKEVPDSGEIPEELYVPPNTSPWDVNSLVDIAEIVNIGKQIWKVITDNKPVVDVKTDVAHALPKGVEGWQEMGNWQMPKARSFQMTYKNLMGMKVVDFVFRIIYTYGGNYQGKGQYLTQITVIPASVDVAWGFKFSSETKIPEVVNQGTPENPLAGAHIEVAWKVETPLKHAQETLRFFVRGDGEMEQLK